MLRKNMKPRISRDQRGKITCGTKKTSKNGKEYPASLDHFNVSKFPELTAIYGDKPDKLIVYFPSNNIEDFFSTEYNLWGGKKDAAVKLRSCDGETCRDLRTEEVKPCFCASLPEKDQCKSYTALKAFIADQDGKVISPIPYQFESHSDNSSDNTYSQLVNIWNLTGGKLVGVPFVLSVKFVKKATGQQFPIWELQSINNIQAIIAFAERSAIPTTASNSIPIDLSGETPELAAGVVPGATLALKAGISPIDEIKGEIRELLTHEKAVLLSAENRAKIDKFLESGDEPAKGNDIANWLFGFYEKATSDVEAIAQSVPPQN